MNILQYRLHDESKNASFARLKLSSQRCGGAVEWKQLFLK